MARKLEILVIEDQESHLAQAKAIAAKYRDVKFTFVDTLEKAEHLLEDFAYDAAVSDVIFPSRLGRSPNANSGLSLGKRLYEKGIPFVFNTSGNHHGGAYAEFGMGLEAYFTDNNLRDNIGLLINERFSTGKIIESYPEDYDAEGDTKQWEAAFNYVILLAGAEAESLSEEVKSAVESFLSFSGRGDYGKLTERMERALNPENSLNDMCRGKDFDGSVSYSWERRARYEAKDKGRESDAEWILKAEEKLRDHYIFALDFIRTTIADYTR
jgi:hypothetical protein